MEENKTTVVFVLCMAKIRTYGIEENAHKNSLRCVDVQFINLGMAAEKSDKATFNIPRQRADLSLISFAEQADITLLFPLDKIEGKQTNKISGSIPS